MKYSLLICINLKCDFLQNVDKLCNKHMIQLGKEKGQTGLLDTDRYWDNLTLSYWGYSYYSMHIKVKNIQYDLGEDCRLAVIDCINCR